MVEHKEKGTWEGDTNVVPKSMPIKKNSLSTTLSSPFSGSLNICERVLLERLVKAGLLLSSSFELSPFSEGLVMYKLWGSCSNISLRIELLSPFSESVAILSLSMVNGLTSGNVWYAVSSSRCAGHEILPRPSVYAVDQETCHIGWIRFS